MNLTQQPTARTSTATALSRPSIAAAAALFGGGLIVGAVNYAHRSPIPEVADPSSWARPQHLIIAAVGAIWLIGTLLRRRRAGRTGRLFLAPVGRSAAQRFRATARSAPWRLLIGLPALALLVFQLWRAGLQVTWGLDPNETANAWGGPGYWGALGAHYLDAALLAAVAAALLNLVLVRIPSAGRAAAEPLRS